MFEIPFVSRLNNTADSLSEADSPSQTSQGIHAIKTMQSFNPVITTAKNRKKVKIVPPIEYVIPSTISYYDKYTKGGASTVTNQPQR